MKKIAMFFASLLVITGLIIGCATVSPKTETPQPVYQPRFSLPVEITSQSPAEINYLAPADVWDGLLKMGISNFFHRADTYHWDPWCTQSGTELSKECQVVYGVLAPEDFWGYVPREYWYREPYCDPGVPTADLKKTLFTVMKSEQLLMITYEWLKPYYRQTFTKLTPESQQIYLEALLHAQTYLQQFDYDKELTYLEQIKAKNLKSNQEEDATEMNGLQDLTCGFAYTGPTGNTHFRKVEAFIFRRVHNGDMTAEQMLHWANILQKDFAPLAEAEKPISP